MSGAMDCREVKSQIVFYVCRERFPPSLEERVEAHLAGCAECQSWNWPGIVRFCE